MPSSTDNKTMAAWPALITTGCARTARRFPVPLLCTFLLPAIFLALLLDLFGNKAADTIGNGPGATILFLVRCWAFGLPASLAASLFSEARDWPSRDRHLLSVAALLAVLPLTAAQAHIVPAAIGLALLAFLAPVMAQSMSPRAIWAFGRSILGSLWTALLTGIPAYILMAALILENVLFGGFYTGTTAALVISATIWLLTVPWIAFLTRLPNLSAVSEADSGSILPESGSRWRRIGLVSVALPCLLALGAVFAMVAIMAVPLTKEFIFPDRIVILYFAGLVTGWLGTSCLWLARGGHKSPSRAIAALALLLIAGSVGPWSAKAMEYRVAMRQLISFLQASGHMVGGRLIETSHPDTEAHVHQHGNIRMLAILTYHSDYRGHFVQWFAEAGGDEFIPNEWPHTRADNEILYIIDVLGPFE